MKKVIFFAMMLPFFILAEEPNLKVTAPQNWKKPFKGLELYTHPKNKNITLVIQKFNYKKELFLSQEKLAAYLKKQEQVRSVANATVKVRDWAILKNDFTEHQFPHYQKISYSGVFKEYGKEIKFKEIEYFLGKKSVQANISYPATSQITQDEIEKVLSQVVVVK